MNNSSIASLSLERFYIDAQNVTDFYRGVCIMLLFVFVVVVQNIKCQQYPGYSCKRNALSPV